MFNTKEGEGGKSKPMVVDSGYSTPNVSVIIPTYNRAVLLVDTLHDLLAQDYPSDMLEIIVVDNSSSDNTEEAVYGLIEGSPFRLRYFRKENRGPASARNFGLAYATGDVVAFTDSDCRMGTKWVNNAVQHMKGGVGVVSGSIRPVVNPRRPSSFFSHQIDHRDRNPLFPTANVFFRRDSIEQAGGFDEGFGAYAWGPPVGGDDTDLAWRVKRAGYRSCFAEDAPVDHVSSDISILAWLIEPLRKEVMPLLVAKIPELRQALLWKRVFIDRYTATFDLALVGLIVALVSRKYFILVLAIPWLWIMRGWAQRDIWPPSRWWRIPIKYALLIERYFLQAVTLLVSSIRYRSLVL